MENLKGILLNIEENYFIVESLVLDGNTIPWKVVYPKTFNSAIRNAVIGNTIQLLNLSHNHNTGCLEPELVILEPDYLVDVSSVAECMREYGSHPFYFLMNRFSDKANSAAILLGNAANFFLDELIYTEDVRNVDVNTTIRRYFQLYALEISSCKDLQDRPTELQFFENLRLHFENLKNIVQFVFKEKEINRNAAILEPSFICPNLGLQGRLDFFENKQNGKNSVIELKSGKTPFGDYTNQAIGLNHRTQASLYQMIIQQVLGIAFSKLETYICYSRCNMNVNPLRLAYPSMALIAEALNIRNHIALNDYKIAFGHMKAEELLGQIVPSRMIKSNNMDSKLARQYIIPHIEAFSKNIQNARALDRAYFFSFYRFLIKEQWLSKCGSVTDKEKSLSALWELDYDTKKKAGSLMDALLMIDRQVQYGYTIVTFSFATEHGEVADFREGDIVVLYPKQTKNDNATKHQIFKGSVLSIGEDRLVLRLRNNQHENALSLRHTYCIEHDFLESNFTIQFRGLYQFLSISSSRKKLILGERAPIIDANKSLGKINVYSPFIQELLKKVDNAKELFLLVGPPGTGKTSIALRNMVAYYYQETPSCILLSAYTNRAVDEICTALETIQPNIDYVRIGSHVNCPDIFQRRLLNEQIKSCTNRNSVRQLFSQKRIFVGTVAALSANTELLNCKHFELAIIDEASQILDPLLLNLFCSKNTQECYSIDKFVLIGDHKQLPAVCLQEQERFQEDILINKGIKSGQISFFERMLGLYQTDENIVMQLSIQGRMHPALALFANTHFYKSSLSIVPLPHQTESLSWNGENYHGAKRIVATKRHHFFPIVDLDNGAREEAEMVAVIVRYILEIYQDHSVLFSEKSSLGIITPFRNQISLIRKSLRLLGITPLDNVVVDTVERYQGSQKDIIIYALGVYSQKQLRQVTDAKTVCDGKSVDRKMNVALTRARKQFFLVGSAYWVQQDPLYRELADYLNTSKN